MRKPRTPTGGGELPPNNLDDRQFGMELASQVPTEDPQRARRIILWAAFYTAMKIGEEEAFTLAKTFLFES